MTQNSSQSSEPNRGGLYLGPRWPVLRRTLAIATPLLMVSGISVVLPAAPSYALGPSAIVSGFNSTAYGGNDDGTYPCAGSGSGVPGGCTPTAVGLPFSPDFFGTTYSSLYVNNNGDLTFGQPLGTYTPYPLSQAGPPIIAPFFADVDTRTGNTVTFGTGTVNGHNAFGVNWPGVGCYSETTSVLNYFQVLLIDRSDVGQGDFDIEYNYDQIQWDSGQADNGGPTCQGGTSARAGYASGTAATGSYYEIPGSGTDGAFLDTDAATGLVHNSYNSGGQLGRYVYQFRNGQPGTTTGAPQSASGIGSGQVVRHNPTCNRVHPVNCASGNFWHTFTDLTVPGRGPGLALTRTYNSLNASTRGIFGYGWSSSYDTHLTPNSDGSATITAGDGSSVTALSNGGSYTLPGWSDSSLAHNADGTWTYVRQATETFTFDGSGRLSRIADPNGYATTLAYNPAGQLATVTDAAGRTLTFSFGSNGLVSQVSDPARHVSYGYDTSGNLTSVTDANNDPWAYGYDTNHLLLSVTDPANDTTTNSYDSGGRVLTQKDPAGLITTFSYAGSNYSAAGGSTTITDPHGNSEVQNYVSGELTSMTKASGSNIAGTWTYTLDPTTLAITAVTDPNHHTATFSYDPSGNLLSATDALTTNTMSYTYNALNEPLTSQDSSGVGTSYTYDSAGNLLTRTITGAGGTPVETTKYSYGDAAHPGDLTQVTDPAGHVLDLSYDSYGDVASVTTHPSPTEADRTTAVYDAIGRKVCQTSPKATAAGVACPAAGQPRTANTSTWSYDGLGDVLAQTDPLGNTTNYAYDGDQDRTQVTDPLGKITKTLYDGDNRPTSVTAGYGTSAASTTSYAYDLTPGTGSCSTSIPGASYCTSSTDGDGQTTVTYLDARDQQVAQSQPGAGTTTSGYDPAGNLASLTSPAGSTGYDYDQDNRLTSISYTSPGSGFAAASSVTYGYNSVGQRTSMTDGTGTTSYGYDSLNRLTSVTDGAGAVVGYGYDLDNQITSITYPNGKTVSNGYDNAGRQTTVTDWLGKTTNFSYDADSNLTSEAYPNTVTAAYGYDNADQPTSITDTRGSTTLANFNYTRNADWQVATETNTGVPAPTSNSYGYDPLSRLDSSTAGAYGYDNAGNLTATPTGTLSYTSTEQLASSTLNGTTTNYTYDAHGNRISASSGATGTTAYGYDEADRLVNVTPPASTNVHSLAAGYYFGLVYKNDGTAWAWGDNRYGQVGNGSKTATIKTPVQVTGLSGAVSVGAGQYHSLAIKSDGTVWAWGSNAFGQLGNNSTKNSTTPVQVSGLTSAASVAGGGSHSLAVKSNGTVSAWGYNGYGQLGNNSTTQSKVPVQVAGLTGATAVAAGYQFSVALKSDGTVWTWGDNSAGELGNNSTTESNIPVQVSGLTGVVAIAAGGYHALALKSDGTVWTWGDNSNGDLGNNSTSQSNVPVQVVGLTAVASIGAGTYHSLAVKSDGTLWAWGYNAYGQLGNNTTTDSHLPVQVSGISGATAATGGIYFSEALKTDGTVWTWGSNANGQLGTGTTTDSHTPVQAGVSSVKTSTASGSPASYAYNGDGLRTAKTVNGTTSRVTWDIAHGLPLILNDGSFSYIYGPDGIPIEQIDTTGSPTYLHQDQLGSTRLLTDPSGNVTATYTFDPYGRQLAKTGTGTTQLGFASGYADPESGLIYLRARYYDPSTGQFITRDPVAASSRQPYQYTNDDPLNELDPTGLCVRGFGWACKAGSGLASGVSSAASAVGNGVSSAANWTYNNVVQPVGSGIATGAEWVGNHPVEAGLIVGGAVLLVGGGVFAVAAGGELFETIAAADTAGEYLDAAELSLKAPLILLTAGGTAIAGGGLIGIGSYLLATEHQCQ